MKKGILTSFLLTLLIGTFIAGGLFGLNACKNNGKSANPESSLASADTMKLPCLLLNKSTIQQWVDSGWMNPASPYRSRILLFQFQAANPAEIKTDLGLVCSPGRSIASLHDKVTLEIDSVSARKAVIGPAIFANLVLRLDSLDILNPNGTLKNFDYVRLRPNTTFKPPFIAYDVEVVTGNMTVAKEAANPCPPCKYCPGGACPAEIAEQ